METLQQMIDQARSIVFFGGAGVSTESGIKDFRSQDGLYRMSYAYPPEEILSHSFFEACPGEFYKFYRDKMIAGLTEADKAAGRGIGPNPAHIALAKLEEKGKMTGIVTQNIDGLHQAAGSKKVMELHGSVHRNYCTRCGRFYPIDAINDPALLDKEGVPRCPACRHGEAPGAIIKPDVVLYEEGLSSDVLEQSLQAIESADLMIVGGTSLNVYPAAGLLRYFRGSRLVLINRDPTPADRSADLVIRDPIGQVLGNLKL